MFKGNCNKELKRSDFNMCIFQCKDSNYFFKIPKQPTACKAWLKRLGLNSTFENAKVCDKHFSEAMMAPSGKRIKKYAMPDRNLSYVNGIISDSATEKDSNQLDNIIDQLLRSDDNPNEKYKPKIDIETKSIKDSLGLMPTSEGSKSFAGDSSKLLVNYQLQKQGEHVCNVIEIPQFILVFTAFRSKDTYIIPPSDNIPDYGLGNGKDVEPEEVIHNNKPSINQERLGNIEIVNNKEYISIECAKPPRELKYVHYTPPECVLTRERQTQVQMSAEAETTTTAVQCDMDEEYANPRDDNSQFEWINHIIEDHVLNAEGDMYECHICGEIAASYASNLRHSMMHKESSSLCYQCGRLYSNHVKLKNHEKRAHQPNNLEMKKALRCPKFHCTKAFHSKRQLFDHIDQHNSRAEHKCSKCWRTFTSFLQFRRHKSRRNCWR